MLLGQGIEPDPAAELCRLLNINRQQLPERFELEPGEVIPDEVLAQLSFIDTELVNLDEVAETESQSTVESNHPD